MRVSSAFNRMLDLEGVWVREVDLDDPAAVVVTVALRRRKLVCPLCDFTTSAATRPHVERSRGGDTWT